MPLTDITTYTSPSPAISALFAYLSISPDHIGCFVFDVKRELFFTTPLTDHVSFEELMNSDDYLVVFTGNLSLFTMFSHLSFNILHPVNP